MSSELRQRKGEKADGPRGEMQNPDVPSVEELKERVTDMLQSLKPNPAPGLTNRAKEFKDKLALDPFNMELIYELGAAYAGDEMWDRSANVMLRGMKRISELKDPANRFQFSCILCQASMHTQKFRQALAVINDACVPDDLEADSARAWEVLKCQVYCRNGEMQKGLKAFHKAIEDVEFHIAISVWAGCSSHLKKVGAWAVTKTTLVGLAKTDQDKQRIEALEKLAEIKDVYIDEAIEKQTGFFDSPTQKALFACIVFLLLGLMYLLWQLETANLKAMKMIK
eukprot:TRINITY_DN69040_c0_g1_i1.p1 TRINITY_DN69040_c0_g1~~TRINITY_DN69040_c0_g1_i1.p1  ORF type:complete len:282 (-),score=65.86 TRINITY_DN69040_c0_g1_i1:143-988(-)